jgi:DNA-binding protein H-NS
MTLLKIAMPLTLILIAGCQPPPTDERLARMAEQSVEQQANQNTEMARLNREVAEGTNRLVEADSQARQELLAAQRDLQRHQEQVGMQRDALESERKVWAGQRRTESVLAPIVSTLGMTLLALLPLVLCWRLLHGLGRTDEHQIGDLLIQEIVSPEPTLLPPPAGPSRGLEYQPEPDRNLGSPPAPPDQPA